MRRNPDVRVRTRKIASDIWDARLRLVAAALVVSLASIGVAVRRSDMLLVSLLVSMALVGVAQASAPFGHARASERFLLRALGADDRAAVTFARLEGGLLGGIAALIALVVDAAAGSPVWAMFWIVASAGAGAIAVGR